MFFSGRSDYFKALLQDHFSEGGQLQSLPSTPVITLHNISHEVFIHVMYYIYSNTTEVGEPLQSDVCSRQFVETLASQATSAGVIKTWELSFCPDTGNNVTYKTFLLVIFKLFFQTYDMM